MNITYIKDNLVFNFQKGSRNTKTGDSVQVFILPLEWIVAGKILKDDSSICFDCVHSQQKNKSCYVRKGFAGLGLISKVKSLHSQLSEIRSYNNETLQNIISLCTDNIIRFGAYGEPVLLGEELVYLVTKVAKGWVGYTHQWMRPNYKWASAYFMASTETLLMRNLANKLGFRSFIVTESIETIPGSSTCPASKESGKKTTCNKCLLCSGTKGKGDKDVNIKKH